MTFTDVENKTTLTGFSAADMATILAAMKTAYEGSATAKVMFDSWISAPGKTISIDFLSDEFGAVPNEGKLSIDLSKLTSAMYIDNNGTAVKDTAVGAIVHELVHALTGRTDDYNATDYRGKTVTFSNTIYRELGLPEQNSYIGYDSSGILTLNFQYTNGAAIDRSVALDNNWDSSAAGNSKDLLIGGASKNLLVSGDGNDFLYGNGGDDTLDGGSGNDTLVGGTDDDTLDGGEGNDTLLGGTGADSYQFSGNFGHDTVRDSDGQGSIKIDGATLSGGKQVASTVWESDDKAYVYARNGADLIIGQRTRAGAATLNTIVVKDFTSGQLGITLGGDAAPPAAVAQSEITVYQSSARTAGGQGSLTQTRDGQTSTVATGGDYSYQVNITTGQSSFAYSGEESQTLLANAYDQQISTGAGNDLIITSGWGQKTSRSDTDTVSSGAGSDMVFTGLGSDIIDAGAGDDFIMSGGLASLAPSPPQDPASQIPANAGWVRPGMGNWGLYNDSAGGDIGMRLNTYGLSVGQYLIDPSEGAIGDDIVDAGDGNDRVYGGQGNDLLELGAGNDFAVGYRGSDQIMGGAGADFIVGDGLYTGALIFVDQLSESQSGNDELYGGDGNDVLLGQAGNDTLSGDDGNDDLYGDDADFLSPGASYAADLGASEEFCGEDWLDGGNGNDRLVGGGKDDALFGGAGNDILLGDNNVPAALPQSAHGNDYLDGEDGDDALYGGGGADQLFGGAGNDVLDGDSDGTALVDAAYQGDDYLDGEDGDDLLLGGGGNDTLYGGSGNDTLQGGKGDDILNGGEGNDSYVYKAGWGRDTIVDSGGYDTLYLDSWASLANLHLGIGSLKIFTDAPGEEVHIEGFDPQDPLGSGTIERFVLSDGTAFTYEQLLNGKPIEQFGTAGDDVMTGTPLQEIVSGYAGNDTITTGLADDQGSGHLKFTMKSIAENTRAYCARGRLDTQKRACGRLKCIRPASTQAGDRLAAMNSVADHARPDWATERFDTQSKRYAAHQAGARGGTEQQVLPQRACAFFGFLDNYQFDSFLRMASLRKGHKTHQNSLLRSAANARRCPCAA